MAEPFNNNDGKNIENEHGLLKFAAGCNIIINNCRKF